MRKQTGGAVLRAVRSAAVGTSPTDRELLDGFVGGDEAAFAALVNRHAGMVLGVCRRALHSAQDAEDACQAVFLILASKADHGRWQPSIANWLYATARRVAAKAIRASARRVKREARATPAPSESPLDQMTGREAFAALDEELDRLPAIYREPLVLCYLEGLTRDEAAARLGVPAATLKSQLDRGRKKLADVLTRRGVALGAGLLALAVTSPAGASPPRLVASILTAAKGSPSAAVGELVRGVAVNGSLHKVVLALAAVVVVALGAGLGALETNAALPAPEAEAKPAPPGAEKDQPKDAPAKPAPKEATVTGRVLDPEGKPLPGAKLYLSRNGVPQELGTSGADGKFRVKVPDNRFVYLTVRAEGVGLDFTFIPQDRLGEPVDLQTVKDHAVRGRIVDTQGKPIAGATVAVSRLIVYDDSLDVFLSEFKAGGYTGGIKSLWREVGVLPTATTDKDGRFVIEGAGAERLLTLRVVGTGLAETELWVVNRKGFDPKPYNEAKPDRRPGMPGYVPPRAGLRPDGPRVLHAPEVSVIAEPEKRIRGTVTDVDTGKPRVGVRVGLTRNEPDFVLPLSAVTDADGTYEIRGARKSARYTVSVDGDPDTRHVAARVRADDTAGYEPLTADIKVKKGVIVTGKVIDTGTKKPVRGYASIAVLADNKFVKDYPEFGFTPGNFAPTNEEGTFRVVTIPGPVLLMGGSYERDAMARYKRPEPDPKYPQYFDDRLGRGVVFRGSGNALGLVQGSFCKVLEIKADAETVTQDILLEPVK
jgi:RNA polymerase sigma factor (sigma-70 family)